MLGVLPLRRKNGFSVLACGLWNLTLLVPFVIAFWVLTEINEDRQRGYCAGIPWDVSKFARWAFLGMAIYQIVAIPVNMCNLRREERLRGYKTHNWLRMFDALHWLANWALWFYFITALAHRDACPWGPLRGLIWAVVWISTAFAIVGLLAGLVGLCMLIAKNYHEIQMEASRGVDSVAARVQENENLKHTMATGTGAVEVLDVRRSQPDTLNRLETHNTEPQYVREAQMKKIDPERRRIDLEEHGVLDKRHEGERVEEVQITRSRREVHEVVNIRDDARADIEEVRHVDNRNIRSTDPRGGHIHNKY